MKRADRIIQFVTGPFVDHALLFALLLFAFNGLWVKSLVMDHEYGRAVAAVANGVILVYLIVFALSFSTRIRRIVAPVLLFLFLVHSVVDEVCFLVMRAHLNVVFWQTILATNFSETKEFIQTYMNASMFIGGFLFFGFFAVLYYLAEYKKNWVLKGRWLRVSRWAFILLIAVSFAEMARPTIMFNFCIPELSYFAGRFSLEKLNAVLNEGKIDLKKSMLVPELEKVGDSAPQKFVVVIGESYSKSHCGLYGYEKETTPKLRTLQNDSLLAVFNNVRSSDVHTTAVFKTFLNTYGEDDKDSLAWYEAFHLIKFLEMIGFRANWVSAQMNNSFFESVQDKNAQLCDSVVYVDARENPYDGSVLRYVFNGPEKESVFYHLMGQHTAYEKRYSADKRIFSEKDYAAYPENQRSTLAHFDNATLYNDSIVYELMSSYKDDDAIVFYFPDHGQDLYDADSAYAGHGRDGISESFAAAQYIPFVVYMSPVYKEKHPDEVTRIFASVDKEFVTDDFAYSIIDLLGYKFAKNDKVSRRSLFN